MQIGVEPTSDGQYRPALYDRKGVPYNWGEPMASYGEAFAEAYEMQQHEHARREEMSRRLDETYMEDFWAELRADD